MRATLCILSAVTLMVIAAVAEPGPSRGKGSAGGGRGPSDEDWRRLDRDSDGRVSFLEFAAHPRLQRVPEERRREIFNRLDKNSDGWIEGKEMRSPGGEHRHRMTRLRELDRNGDGVISFEEFSAGRMMARLPEEKRRALFAQMDGDGNGVLDGKDRPKRGPGPVFRIGELDRDGSGGVSFAEFSAGERNRKMPEELRLGMFKRLDRDGDGEIRKGETPAWGEGGRKGPFHHGTGSDRFEQLDADHNGSLSFEEYRCSAAVASLGEDAQEDHFEEHDRDGNLTLSPEEFKGPREEGGARKGSEKPRREKPRREGK